MTVGLLGTFVGPYALKVARGARRLRAERERTFMHQKVLPMRACVSPSMSKYWRRRLMMQSAIAWCCPDATSGILRASCPTPM
ncbi:hypothetical protein BVG81_003540 [Haliangium sp. UPWRP_2]|nr:hypothetical protein BVG81_003540 [Haliangium sp. UPWRP_2]